MATTTLFRRGIPTEPDVVTLTQTFGVPEIGHPIPYVAIAEILGIAPTAHRFRTVTTAWRKLLRSTHNVILVARDGAFARRDASSRTVLVKSKTKHHLRGLNDTFEIAQTTDRAALSERERGDLDKVMRVTSIARSAALAEARKAAVPKLRAIGTTPAERAEEG